MSERTLYAQGLMDYLQPHEAHDPSTVSRIINEDGDIWRITTPLYPSTEPDIPLRKLQEVRKFAQYESPSNFIDERNITPGYLNHSNVLSFVLRNWRTVVDTIEGPLRHRALSKMFALPEIPLFRRPGDQLIDTDREGSTTDCIGYNGNGRLYIVEVGTPNKPREQLEYQLQQFANYFPSVPCVGVIARFRPLPTRSPLSSGTQINLSLMVPQ